MTLEMYSENCLDYVIHYAIKHKGEYIKENKFYVSHLIDEPGDHWLYTDCYNPRWDHADFKTILKLAQEIRTTKNVKIFKDTVKNIRSKE